jgi:dTMP kinase
MLRLKSGLYIGLEGPDAAGKSTQAKLLARKFPETLFTHQPSGGSELGKEVYALTEGRSMAGMTRQLLHLAAHSEQYVNEIIPALTSGKSVVTDRFWMSTIVYGAQAFKDLPMEFILELVQLPTLGYVPDLVYLFNHPYREDPHNVAAVLYGYKAMADAENVYEVPEGDVSYVTKWIIHDLKARGLAEESED